MQEIPHHDNESLENKVKEIGAKLVVGATGKFPDGHLTENDEGELRIMIGLFQGKVILAFGKPITWIGFGPHQARQFAEMLRDTADKAWAAMERREDDDPKA